MARATGNEIFLVDRFQLVEPILEARKEDNPQTEEKDRSPND
jgi:hypothetical protein